MKSVVYTVDSFLQRGGECDSNKALFYHDGLQTDQKHTVIKQTNCKLCPISKYPAA